MTKNFDDRYEVQTTEEGATLIKRRQDYVCDTKDEIGQIKTGGLLMGSTALAVRASALYALDSEGSWYNVKDPDDVISGGGGGSLSITLDPGEAEIDLANGEPAQVYIYVTGTMPAGASLHASFQYFDGEPYASVSSIMQDADDEPPYVQVNGVRVGEGGHLSVTIEDDEEFVYAESTANVTVIDSGQ